MTKGLDNPLLRMHQDGFDLVADGVLWVDASGHIQHANPAAASYLGYERSALTRSTYFEIDPHFSLLGWKKFWSRLSDKEQDRLETEFVNADGKLFSVRGKAGFDLYADDPELCLIVFTSTEESKRERDLLEIVEENLNVGTWEWNLNSGQIYLSYQVRQWLGWSPERDYYPVSEFLEKAGEQLSAEQRADIRNQVKAMKTSAKPFEIVVELGPPDARNTFLLQGRSVENELEVYKIFGSMRPPDPANAASLLPKMDGGNGIYDFSLNQAHEAAYWIDLETKKIVYANYRAVEMTGYNRSELIGLDAHKLGDDNAESRSESIFETLRATRYVETERPTRRKDGSFLPSRSRLYYYKEESDRQEFMIAFVRDLREEESSQENLQLHRTTLDTLTEWVIWVDGNNRVVLLNTAATRKLSRKTSLDLVGMDIRELMPDLDIPSLARVRQEQLDGRVRSTVDYLYATTSGDQRELQVRFAQVSAGEQLFLCVICRDTTAQYSAKRKLIQTKRRVEELTKQLQSENEALKEQIDQVNTSGPIITVSRKYQEILAQVAQVAGTDATVLITGETGTGKELLAQSIHNFSKRSKKQLVSVNCAALPENLIESELFGHERGSFTGAFTQKKGKFEIASGGTIFLDEIGELPLDMQAKLLRALQEGEIQRIGSTEVINVDIRVVAATNRNLERMIDKGTFREDLYYRLNVFPIHNLPLRERPEDIPVLVKHFTRIYSERMGRNITQINQVDLEKLQAYDFPGNVRELINLVERAVITSPASTLNLGASLRALRRTERTDGEISFRNEKIIPFEEMQKQYIVEALKRTKGKVTGAGGAAELLDINGRTLMSKMNKLGINRNEYTS